MSRHLDPPLNDGEYHDLVRWVEAHEDEPEVARHYDLADAIDDPDVIDAWRSERDAYIADEQLARAGVL
jgi:hypothetical protein